MGDFDVSAFIITYDRQHIPYTEYDDRLDGEGMFVMITNDELNTDFGDDNSICIYKDWVHEVNKVKEQFENQIAFKLKDSCASCCWQINFKEIPNTFKLNRDNDFNLTGASSRDERIRKHLDGYRTNKEIMRNTAYVLNGTSPEKNIPAIMVAHHTKAVLDGQTINGFLPAIGQLLFIDNNTDTINTAFKRLHMRDSLFKLDKTHEHITNEWWSATQYNNYYAWSLLKGNTNVSSKTSILRILPIFAI